MKIKINTVLSALQVMARIAGERHSIRFAYRIQRIYDKLLAEAKSIDGQRHKMQDRFGMITLKDGSIGFPSIEVPKIGAPVAEFELAEKESAANAEKMKAVEKEWTEFCDGEAELDCFTLPMSLIEKENELAEKQKNIQPIAISAGDLIALGPIFEDDDPEALADKDTEPKTAGPAGGAVRKAERAVQPAAKDAGDEALRPSDKKGGKP